jgi:predicted TIM-barrel fold metal-dependent hydrolase
MEFALARPPRVDVHQHLLGEPLRAALAARTALPRLRRRDRAWVLEVAGEPPYRLDPRSEDVGARVALAEADGLDLALVSLSTALGIEGLARDDAAELIDAYERGLEELPRRFAGWGSAPLADPDPDDVDALLRRGRVGLTLPAGALATHAGIERCGPLLERLEALEAPLFVHPGPSPWEPSTGADDSPGWWPALTAYIAQMNAAWHAFVAVGRLRHARLRVVFALLAGAAPLHVERLAARGGPAARVADPGLHYDLSSYGPRAAEAVGRVVGVRQLVYGSDRPLVEPSPLTESVWAVAAAENGARVALPMRDEVAA